MIKNFFIRWKNAGHDFRYFMYGVLLLGITSGIQNSTFNNYLHDLYALTSTQRGFLEFPRELPGFLLIFIVILLSAYSCRIWAVIVGLATGIGLLGLGCFSSNYLTLTLWLLVWSFGEHLYMTVENTMGLQLAKTNAEGRKLGQVYAARNLAMIIGSFIVWFAFGKLGMSYTGLYIIAFIFSVTASITFYKLKTEGNLSSSRTKFIYRKKYNLFYMLNILFGVRKQLFLTFSPWVLVSIFNVKPQTIALLIMIASLAGFVFRQFFGEMVDKYGEKLILSIDAIILMVICAGFAFIKNVYFLYAFFIIDNLMFATRIARATYLNKITENKEEIPSTLSLGTTLDHGVSMIIPLMGGLLWSKFGYPSVFIAASFFAIINLLLAAKIDIKR